MAAAVTFSDSARAQEFGTPPVEGAPSGSPGFGSSHSGFSIVEPPAGLPKADRGSADEGSGRWFFRSWGVTPADSAERMFRDANAALAAGRTSEAQRLFERLIAESPRSPYAQDARQHLGRIYSGESMATAPTGSINPPAAVKQDGLRNAALPWSESSPPERAVAAGPPALDVVAPVPHAVVQAARVSPMLDEQFISNVGDRVFFGAGSANLGTRALAVLQAQARFLTRHPEVAVAIEGHADDGPLPETETVRLSEERAAAVRKRLIEEGVSPDRLTAYGRGRAERLSDCPEAACLAQNRRAVTILVDARRRLVPSDSREARGGRSGPATAPTQ